jgi:hypothetical protein
MALCVSRPTGSLCQMREAEGRGTGRNWNRFFRTVGVIFPLKKDHDWVLHWWCSIVSASAQALTQDGYPLVCSSWGWLQGGKQRSTEVWRELCICNSYKPDRKSNPKDISQSYPIDSVSDLGVKRSWTFPSQTRTRSIKKLSWPSEPSEKIR